MKKRYEKNEDGYKAKMLTLRLDFKTYERLKEIANRKSTTMSEVVRSWIWKQK